MPYQTENDALVNSFLERTFLATWRNQAKGNENYRKLELFLNTKCDLNCAYCYVARFGKQLYPPKLQKDRLVLGNLNIVLDWLIENKMAPELEIFSGEPLSQNIGYRALDMILDKFRNAENKPRPIVVPTNFTFILDDDKTRKVEQLLVQSREIGMPIILSASIDGKYCEANRPFKRGGNDPRDDAYYGKVFAFCKKWHFSFHPMIYSQNIEHWPANFLWFQKMFVEHGIPWDALYLLHVRNVEWDRDSTVKFQDFISWLIEWVFTTHCHNRPEEFLSFAMRNSRGFNILGTPLTTCGRGIGCSIQSTIHLRLGDLAIVPCHRTSYPGMNFAHFEVEDGRIAGIKADNPELMIAIASLDSKNQPMCEECLIKDLCSGGCLGSQFETTGDLFSPIPSVCRLEHAKIRAMITAYKELRVFDLIRERVNPEKRNALNMLEEMTNGTGRPEKVPGNS